MRWRKILGLAGFASIAATGVVIARAERRRRSYTPQQIRDRLHERLAEAPLVTGLAISGLIVRHAEQPAANIILRASRCVSLLLAERSLRLAF